MSRNKSNIISPELIELDMLYSITLNPDDDLQYWTSADRVKSLEGYFTTYILKTLPVALDIHMEVSRTGRLHYHGTIEFKHYSHVYEFYVFHINKLLKRFQIEIDTIADPEDWHDYCIKSKHIMTVGHGCVNIATNSTRLKKLITDCSVKYKPIA